MTDLDARIAEDPEVIYLEPACCADPAVGRTWCRDDAFECKERVPATKYIRFDLYKKVVHDLQCLI